MLEIFFSLAQIYSGLFLTAELIDSLLAENFTEAATMAAWLLFVNLFFGVAIHLVKRRFHGMKNKIWLLFYVWLREKAFSLDYETMEKPEVAEKILFSERTSDMYGGLGILLYQYCNIIRAVLNILLSVSLVIYLCIAKPTPTQSLIGFLAMPLPSTIMFAIVLAGMMFCSFKVFCFFAQAQKEILIPIQV